MKKWLVIGILELILLLVFINSNVGQPELLPTSLKVTVIDNLGNFVEGADVTLYGSEDDYNSDSNPIAGPFKTDKKGRVTFKGLAAQSYYIDAKSGDKSNMGEGVKTAVLQEGRINKVNTVIL